ncbi:MAG: hypothetical protein KatS3mg087_1357 [Patescibacteria group bacterium]|nr:MAG: hypothetical protein KatS3mg087_1357 [Patescibacteria group bacterium]
MKQSICPHLSPENVCGVASYIVTPPQPIYTSPETCKACKRTNKPHDINEVTRTLAGIPNTSEGPGTALKEAIEWFIPIPQKCNCIDRVAVMNSWGKERCLKELPTILGWLRESALDNGYPYSEKVIAWVVTKIIEKSK